MMFIFITLHQTHATKEPKNHVKLSKLWDD